MYKQMLIAILETAINPRISFLGGRLHHKLLFGTGAVTELEFQECLKLLAHLVSAIVIRTHAEGRVDTAVHVQFACGQRIQLFIGCNAKMRSRMP